MKPVLGVGTDTPGRSVIGIWGKELSWSSRNREGSHGAVKLEGRAPEATVPASERILSAGPRCQDGETVVVASGTVASVSVTPPLPFLSFEEINQEVPTFAKRGGVGFLIFTVKFGSFKKSGLYHWWERI